VTDQKQPLAWRHVVYLLVSLTMVAAPHSYYLPWWTIALVAALIAWRAYLGYARLSMPNRWLLFLIGAGATLGVEFPELSDGLLDDLAADTNGANEPPVLVDLAVFPPRRVTQVHYSAYPSRRRSKSTNLVGTTS